jgi:hypothetical protein
MPLTTPLPAFAAVMLVMWAVLLPSSPTLASQTALFMDDFEGENESSRYPVRFLRHWTIIDSVDLKTERRVPPLCRDTGTCIDLVGTAGLTTGGILSKTSFPPGAYLIGFMLYGSGRDPAGNEIATGGVVGRLQVSLGERSIFANNNIASDHEGFVLMRVRGAGKLRFLAGGAAPDIGPLLDNVVVIRLKSLEGP